MLARRVSDTQCSLLRTLEQETWSQDYGEKILTSLGNPEKLLSRLKIHLVLGTYIKTLEICGWVK